MSPLCHPKGNPEGETFRNSQVGWAGKTKLDGLCLRSATVWSLLHRSTMLSSRNWGFLSSAFVRLQWIQCWLCHLTSMENQPLPLGVCLSRLAHQRALQHGATLRLWHTTDYQKWNGDVIHDSLRWSIVDVDTFNMASHMVGTSHDEEGLED
jgi:hypothetical protein